jgi:glycine betaine/proline transport system permease protein
MTGAAAALSPAQIRRSPWLPAWALLLGATLALWLARDALPWAMEYPRGWEMPLKFWISDFMKWLINEFDLGLFTFKELTRSIAWVLDWPLWLAKSLLSDG